MIKLGENIKRLRLQKELTQEELSEVLGVSPQAISRWENGVAYPDITLLPAIANYFDITLDELMNMNEIRSTEKLNSIFAEVHKLEIDGNIDKAITLLRNAIKTYPNNYSLLSELALALTNKDDSAYLNEAIILSEKVLTNSTSEKVRSTTRANLCFLFLKSGMNEKAVSLGKTLPHIWECREILMPYLTKQGTHSDIIRQSMITALTVLHDMINSNLTEKSFVLGYTPSEDADVSTMLNAISYLIN